MTHEENERLYARDLLTVTDVESLDAALNAWLAREALVREAENLRCPECGQVRNLTDAELDRMADIERGQQTGEYEVELRRQTGEDDAE